MAKRDRTGHSRDGIHVLAVASGGGHWSEMMQIAAAFDGARRVDYATTDIRLAEEADIQARHAIKDYSQTEPLRLLAGALETGRLVWRLRPDVVISTGAAPGLLCLFWGRIIGARTIWVDSIANAERLSLSGRLASQFATLTLTQWESLADGARVQFAGSVL
ncbi:MAG: UDP-N-acetylglucosamine--LPS N-acetylglucosamine transferase [Rhodobacteraceae bacterium]|nr:UDP-N-acetylglucosamine--LPS N-acetylglucosamine transferase [Paracoccaceae bacterium]